MARGSVTSWIGETACGVALTIAGVAFALASRRMQLIDDNTPGPGLAPLFLAILLSSLGLMIAGQAAMRRSRENVRLVDRETMLAVLLMLMIVVLFEWLGFIASTFLFLVSGFVLIGRETVLRAAPIAGAITLLTWALFVKALGVPLPAGVLALP